MALSRNFFTALFAFLAIGAIISRAEGKPPSQIWGGQLATEGEFGASISLAGSGNIYHACGGAIIAPRFVLTAGHCVEKRPSVDMRVRAGVKDIRDTTNVVERWVSKFIIHPDYIPYIKGVRPIQNDLAILVLKDPLPIGGHISQLQLPTQQPEDGTYSVAGWGRNSDKPKTYQYELKTLNMTLKRCDDLPRVICTTAEEGATCPGDSGSPLMRDGYVYGIDSAGFCKIGAPTTWTNVFDYIDWINEIMSKN